MKTKAVIFILCVTFSFLHSQEKNFIPSQFKIPHSAKAKHLTSTSNGMHQQLDVYKLQGMLATEFNKYYDTKVCLWQSSTDYPGKAFKVEEVKGVLENLKINNAQEVGRLVEEFDLVNAHKRANYYYQYVKEDSGFALDLYFPEKSVIVRIKNSSNSEPIASSVQITVSATVSSNILNFETSDKKSEISIFRPSSEFHSSFLNPDGGSAFWKKGQKLPEGYEITSLLDKIKAEIKKSDGEVLKEYIQKLNLTGVNEREFYYHISDGYCSLYFPELNIIVSLHKS